MNPERIAKMKKEVKTSYTKRRKRLVALLKARVDQIEKQKPKTLEEAVEIARQSRRWRRRLGKLVKLTVTVRPSHVLMVNLWDKDTLFRAGSRQKMENLIEEFPALHVAGCTLLCISEISEIEQKGEY